MSGSKYTWSSMNAYFASYLHYNGNDWVKPTHTYLLMPAIDFLNNCVLTVGVKLAKKIGLRYVLLMSIACAYISCFLLIIYPNYFLVLFAMGIFGIGSGLGYFPPIENCWKYYPKSNALIFGICVAGLGLSSSILTPLADFFIVNKNKEKTDGDGYYPEEVANKEEKKLIEDKKDEEENNINEVKTEEVKEKKNISVKELFILFKTKKYLMLLSFCICGLCKF